MKTCFNQATTLKNSTLENDLILTEKVGFDLIEIWICQLEKYLKNNTINNLKSFFDNHRIKPFAFDSFEDINLRDKKGQEELKYDFEKVCEYGAILDCKKAVLVPTIQKDINENYTKKDIDEDLVKVLSELSDIAKNYDMNIAFEPIGFKDCTVRSISHAWEIVKKVDRSNVGLTLDVFNNYIYNNLRDIDDIKNVDVNKIFVFHINDAPIMQLDEYKLDHSDRVLPGTGELPYDRVLNILYNMGYNDGVSVELFNDELYSMDASEVISLAHKRVLDAINEYCV